MAPRPAFSISTRPGRCRRSRWCTGPWPAFQLAVTTFIGRSPLRIWLCSKVIVSRTARSMPTSMARAIEDPAQAEFVDFRDAGKEFNQAMIQSVSHGNAQYAACTPILTVSMMRSSSLALGGRRFDVPQPAGVNLNPVGTLHSDGPSGPVRVRCGIQIAHTDAVGLQGCRWFRTWPCRARSDQYPFQGYRALLTISGMSTTRSGRISSAMPTISEDRGHVQNQTACEPGCRSRRTSRSWTYLRSSLR